MFRILIVDDERIILNGIRMMIQEGCGLSFPTEVVTASNVPQAVEVLEAFSPDLLLTDIRMPVMDGFELIGHVRERYPAMDIVILTSHADFAYAQRAIRFQVTDFILKPIDQNALKATIEQAYGRKREQEELERRLARREVRSMMLYDLSDREMTCAGELVEGLFPHGYFTVIVLEVPRMEGEGKGLARILAGILGDYYDGCDCFARQERGQVVAICSHSRFLVDTEGLSLKFAEKSHCDRFWMGVSISATSYKALPGLYINAVQKIFYEKHFGRENDLAELALFTYQDCVQIFTENEDTALRQLTEGYLEKIAAVFGNLYGPEEIGKSFLHNVLLYLENSSIPVPEGLGDPQALWKSGISRAGQDSDSGELAGRLLACLEDVKEQIRKAGKAPEEDAMTKQMLWYIRQHFREDISLEDLAESVGLHPAYVCTLFKKNVGRSYLACLHGERLQAAKKLLVETDFTVEQIAAQVGYNSASQLARVFRKYENSSPSAFRHGK